MFFSEIFSHCGCKLKLEERLGDLDRILDGIWLLSSVSGCFNVQFFLLQKNTPLLYEVDKPYTPLKFNSSPLKHDGSKSTFKMANIHIEFSGAMLNFGGWRVYNVYININLYLLLGM